MGSYLRITRIPYEEPYHLNLVVEASNGVHSGKIEIYDNTDAINEMARVFVDFPNNLKDTYTWELGSERPEDRFAFHFFFHVMVVNSRGHCLINLRFNNNEEFPQREVSEFSIEAMPVEINQLGEMFREFSKLRSTILEWTVDDRTYLI